MVERLPSPVFASVGSKERMNKRRIERIKIEAKSSQGGAFKGVMGEHVTQDMRCKVGVRHGHKYLAAISVDWCLSINPYIHTFHRKGLGERAEDGLVDDRGGDHLLPLLHLQTPPQLHDEAHVPLKFSVQNGFLVLVTQVCLEAVPDLLLTC